MDNDYDSSHHKDGTNSHQPIMQKVGSSREDLKKWFQEYIAVDGNYLSKDSNVIQVLDTDELDAKFIEQQIQECAPQVSITKGFCAKCQDLFDNWPTLGGSSTREHDSRPNLVEDGWEHATARPCTTFELESSTRLGCRFCAFLLQSLKDSRLLDIFRKIEVRLYHLGENAMSSSSSLSSLSVENWGTNPIQHLWLNLPGKVCTHCNDGIASSINLESSFLPVSANCYDDPRDVLDIASNWLSTCSENHERCRNNDNGTLPTRLLSIAGESPRLVLTSECPKRPRYATLSHCWGSHEVVKLISENLDSFKVKIPVEGLPKTFRDAIEIAHSLGIDYLWIDSLCIIQDSEDDWQKESALMSSIYGGSTITIAASSAHDSTEGCFLKPPNFSGGLRARITDGGRQRVQDFRSSSVYNLSTFETHLGTRAWALQEKILPPRTIHFGDRGAFWECRTTIASEYLPDGFPHQLVSPLVRRRVTLKNLWPDIVLLYSAANLTFAKDKLPALSGIARLVYNETGDQYLAGLWRSQIVEQLCWRRLESKSIAKRPPSWRAPTWSWASIDKKVFWYREQEGILATKYAHVLDASTTKYGHDPFGQVTSGVIRLACSTMVAGYLVYSKNSNKLEAEEDSTIEIHTGNKKQDFPIQIDCLDDSYQEDNGPIYLLPLRGGSSGVGMSEEGKDYDEVMIDGLVLRATGLIKGEFSRVGSFNLKEYRERNVQDNEEGPYGTFLRVLEEHGTATAKGVCAEILLNSKDPNNQYVITLI